MIWASSTGCTSRPQRAMSPVVSHCAHTKKFFFYFVSVLNCRSAEWGGRGKCQVRAGRRSNEVWQVGWLCKWCQMLISLYKGDAHILGFDLTGKKKKIKHRGVHVPCIIEAREPTWMVLYFFLFLCRIWGCTCALALIRQIFWGGGCLTYMHKKKKRNGRKMHMTVIPAEALLCPQSVQGHFSSRHEQSGTRGTWTKVRDLSKWKRDLLSSHIYNPTKLELLNCSITDICSLFVFLFVFPKPTGVSKEAAMDGYIRLVETLKSKSWLFFVRIWLFWRGGGKKNQK